MAKSNIEISYQLYGPRGGYLKETEFKKAKSYALFVNDKPFTRYIQNFPEELKTNKSKIQFLRDIAELIHLELLEKQKKKAKKKKVSKKVKEIKKEIKEIVTGKKEYSLDRVKLKRARGVYVEKDFVFRTWTLHFKKAILVPRHDSVEEFEQFKKIVLDHFEILIQRANRLKDGMRIYFVKIITPQFDKKGRMLLDNKIVNKETGDTYISKKAQYSYGFGTSRERGSFDNLKNSYVLREHMKEMLDSYRESHLAQYEAITSQILLSGIQLEETVQESTRSK